MEKPLRILLAADRTSTRAVLRELLNRAGADVTACRSVRELEAAAADGVGCAVISDLNLSDGPATNLLLRLHQQHPHLPILIMSGDGQISPAIIDLATGIYFTPTRDLMSICRTALFCGVRQSASGGLEFDLDALPSLALVQ